MLPLILAVVGGYLVGDSMKDKAVFANGGMMAKGGEVNAKKRLEELREEIRAERISYGELAELQSLVKYIDENDVELLEAAGVAEGGMMAHGGKVKVGDILTANTGVKVRVVEYDPLFGGRIRAERLDEYATGKPSQFMSLSNFKYADGGMMEDGGQVQKINMGNGVFMDLEDAIKMYEDKINSQGRIVYERDENMLKQLKRMRNNMADGGMMAKGGIYSSDEVYLIEVFVGDKMVHQQKIRAKSQREANEMAEDLEEIFTEDFGDHRTQVKKAPSMMKKGGVARSKKVTYVPQDEIESISTWNGVSFEGDDILDGAYIKGKNRKFAKGGMMAKGGSVESIFSKYEENEENNAHSENVVLLATHFGTKEDLKKAKSILNRHMKAGSLTKQLSDERSEIEERLYPKLVEALKK